MRVKVSGFKSSNVDNYEYDSASQELVVEFKSGDKRYVYKNVERRTFEHLFSETINGGSVGGVMAFVKKHHDCETVDIQRDPNGGRS